MGRSNASAVKTDEFVVQCQKRNCGLWLRSDYEVGLHIRHKACRNRPPPKIVPPSPPNIAILPPPPEIAIIPRPIPLLDPQPVKITPLRSSNGFRIFVDCRADTGSLMKRSSIQIHMVRLDELEMRRLGIYGRKIDDDTDYSFSRFLIPYLADYEGWAMFMDRDFLYGDIKNLIDRIDEKFAIICDQHDSWPKETTGTVQTPNPRKNLYSMILFNCGHTKNLELKPALVNEATAEYLQSFNWLEDDEIGVVPLGRWVVRWFEELKSCEFADFRLVAFAVRFGTVTQTPGARNAVLR